MDNQNNLERIVSALESIGVNLDETDIVGLEWIADPHNTHSERDDLRDTINHTVMSAQFDIRYLEHKEVIEVIATAGFVLNDEDGETWTRENETVKIELVNGQESRYKWEYEGPASHSGVSGEFHRLLTLIGGASTVAETRDTEVPRG